MFDNIRLAGIATADAVDKAADRAIANYEKLLPECASLHINTGRPVMLLLYSIFDTSVGKGTVEMNLRTSTRTLEKGETEAEVFYEIAKTKGFNRVYRYSMFIDRKIWTAGQAIREIVPNGDMISVQVIPRPTMGVREAHENALASFNEAEKIKDGLNNGEFRRYIRQAYLHELFCAEKSLDRALKSVFYLSAGTMARVGGFNEEADYAIKEGLKLTNDPEIIARFGELKGEGEG